MNPASKRRSVAVGILLVLALATGAAYAYWTSAGGGTGAATTLTPTDDVDVTQSGSITDLAPGSGSQTIAGTITNNSPDADAYVTSVSVSLAGTTWQDADGGGPIPACSAGDYTIGGSPGAVGANLTAGGGNVPIPGGMTIAFNNTGANQDSCKGQALVLTFTTD